MQFVWDRAKNRRNLRLHGIDFEEAVRIFDGPTLERIDDRFDYGETRVYAIGVAMGVEVVVVYTDTTGGKRRIISAWKAVKHEREAYWQGLA